MREIRIRPNKQILVLVYFIILSTLLNAQINLSGVLLSKFGDSKTGYNYNESLLNTNITWTDFQLWLQYEYSLPPELGSPFNGLRKVRIEYHKGSLGIKVGDIYEIWGRGLVLNQVDDQIIDKDNGIRGVYLQYNQGPFRLNILTGNSQLKRQSTEVAGNDTRRSNYATDHQVFGTDLSFSKSHYTFGTSFLQSHENHYLGIFKDDSVALTHRIRAGRLEWTYSWIDGFLEYADKKTDVRDPITKAFTRVKNGYGYYGNMNMYLGALTFVFEMKNYRFNEIDPYNRWSTVSHYGGVIDFQNPPTVFRQHTSVLLSRITHQIDFNDELGYQFEMNAPMPFGNTFLLNMSTSSRHSEWISLAPHGYPEGWTKQSIESLAPSIKPSTNPFRELYTEVEGYQFNDRLHYRLGYGWTEDISGLFINIVGDTSNLNYEYKKALTIPTFISLDFSDRYSIEVKMEIQTLWQGYVSKQDTLGYSTTTTSSVFYSVFNEEEQIKAPYQHNRFFDLSLSRAPGWSISLLIDAVDAEEPPFYTSATNPLESLLSHIMDINRKWIALEWVINLNPKNRLTLMYGSQKGGLVCSNGICRYVEAFDDGFKFTLTSIF